MMMPDPVGNFTDFKNLPLDLVIVNKDLKIIECTQAWNKHFHLGAGDYLNKLDFKVDQILSFKSQIIKSLETGLSKIFIEEYDNSTSNSYKWLIYPAHQDQVYLQRILLVSKKKKRLDILREQASRVAEVGYWEVDLVKNTLFWSSVTKKIHKVSDDYIPDLNGGINFYKEGENRDRIVQIVNSAINEGTPWDGDFTIVAANGQEVYVNAKGRAEFEKGKCVRLIGTFQDITERIKKDKKIRETEERFRAAFDNTLIGFVITNATDLKIHQVNSSAVSISGYTGEELIGMSLRDIIHPRDLFKWYRSVIEIKNNGNNHTEVKVRILSKTAGTIYLEVYVSKNSLDDDNFLVQFRDVTELHDKTQDIEKYIELITSQNKRLLNFGHIVSHNMRSHASNIAMLINFMIEEEDEDEQEQQLGLLKNASTALTETLSHLNQVISMDIDQENLEEINLHTVIEKNINSLQGILDYDKFIIHNNVSKTLKISIVPAYLDSIILNMITNAFKYSSEKRVSWLELSAQRENGNVQIIIEDNGLGIDLKRHGDKIFGMYKTFHYHPEAKGLGLFLTKNQVEIMGGTIDVESEVDKGTKFIITLNEKN